MPRVMDGNNSMNSNYSIRTSMLVSLNAKDSIPEHFRKQVSGQASILVDLVHPAGVCREFSEDLGRYKEAIDYSEGHP